MKVLMLGWEFPPHISGGLGTACFGLTQGLGRIGVDVLFVVPRAWGDEDRRAARILGCNHVSFRERVELDGRVPPDGGGRGEAPGAPRAEAEAAPTAAPEGAASGGEAGGEEPPARMETVVIDSPLHPYLTARGYAHLFATLPAHAGALLATLPRAPASPQEWESLVAAIAAERPRRSSVARGRGGRRRRIVWRERTLPFSGQYGPGLMEEVARYAYVVGEVARRNDFDVIHAHDWMTYPAGVAAARVSGKPLVVHVHASEYDRSGDHPNHAVRDIEQLGLDAAGRVVCVSHYTAGVLQRFYRIDAARVRVVHNAVTHQEQMRDWHSEKAIPEPIVLFLGRVTFQKGPDYFLDAAARVVRLRPDVKFVMSGSGDMLPGMVERAARLGLGRNLHFTGFLRGKEVERIYAMADLYVMPSVSEPFGISPLEAMALDVPVIVSRQSGVAEVLRNALKVDFWDVEDLANKILAVLQYPALRDQLTGEGREEVRRMRWEVRAALVRDVYRELSR